jgi:hypothetical protein
MWTLKVAAPLLEAARAEVEARIGVWTPNAFRGGVVYRVPGLFTETR